MRIFGLILLWMGWIFLDPSELWSPEFWGRVMVICGIIFIIENIVEKSVKK